MVSGLGVRRFRFGFGVVINDRKLGLFLIFLSLCYYL